jgi:uncharacterized repeat protein (TIGR01451 family)
VKPGATLTYDLLALNFGPNAASGVKIKDVLPAGVTFVSAGFEDISCALFGGCKAVPQSNACSLTGNMVVCAAGDLKALSLASLDGVGIQIVVKVTATANSVLSNTANVSGLDADPNPGNNTSTAQTTVRR